MVISVMPLKEFIAFLVIITISLNLSGSSSQVNTQLILSGSEKSDTQDTLRDNQLLYNGRIWRDLNYMVQGDPFLLTDSFVKGDLTVRGKKFFGINLKYDIYKDEVLIPMSSGRILQLNKAMVDGFSFTWKNRKYSFTKLPGDSALGYLHILYSGRSALYVKYRKKIGKLAEQGKFDKFYQTDQAYYVQGGIIHTLSGKKDLKIALKSDNDLIKSFMRKNKLKIKKSNPESYIPVIHYLDNIR